MSVPANYNQVGRPVKFKTVEELKKVIDEYFEYCDNRAIKRVDKEGNEYMISSPAPYTMSGLARRIGLSRQGLIDYSKKEEFFDAIREARQRVEEDVENRMMETKNEKGAMFSLKNNFKWKDEEQKGNIFADKVLIVPSELIGRYGISHNAEGSS